MNSFDKLLTNISWMYDKGYPDFTIKEDREALYDYLLSIGFPHSDVIELSERFIREAEIDDDKMIKYKGEDGESKEMKASSAKSMPKDHPAKIEYDRMKGDDGEDEPSGQKLSGPKDFERQLGDEPDRSSKSYVGGKDKFDSQMSNINKLINFENDSDKETFQNVLGKVQNGDLDFSDEEKAVAKKYIAKSDSQKVNKLYISKTGPETYDNKATRGQIKFTDNQKSFMDDLTDKLDLDEAPAQATKSGEKRVASKIRTKDLTPTDINPSEDIDVKTTTDSDGNVSSVTFGKREHKIKQIPDKQKLKDSFVNKGMDPEKAEKKAKQVRRAIKKHNEYLVQLTEDRDKFTVSTMIEGADPSTEEGREKILNEYPKKVAKILEDVIKKAPGGITEDEQKVVDKIKNLDPSLSPEEYEKEAMSIMHDMINNPTLKSGSADLAENMIAMIQTKKGHEVYFPADVTYKVGDMVCLGSLGDLDPNDEDYYDKLADEASSIIVTVEDEGPGSVKVGAGAASAAEEKIRLTEYKNPNSRKILNSIVSTHQDLFKSDPINTEEAKRKNDEAGEHAKEIGVEQDKIDEINSKSEEQAKKWAEKWRKDVKTGSENYTDEDWETLEKNAVQFVRAHLLIAEINNKDMDYQKFSNYRVDNKKDSASMSRTDGVDCLGTVKPAPNMGFKLSEGGKFVPANVYSSRIGNSCKDKK